MSISEILRPTIMMVGVEAALAEYHQLKSEQPEAYNFAENELNRLGYQLLNHGKAKEAVAIFKLNAETYPHSANVYDSLADAYKASGDSALAVQCYEKVLALLPSNHQYSDELRKQLEKNAREGLERFHKSRYIKKQLAGQFC
jgi:tetratricopeptide (TPR) repeat protein